MSTSDLPRARFHEISKPAVERALNNLTSIDENMVEAYLARRYCVCGTCMLSLVAACT